MSRGEGVFDWGGRRGEEEGGRGRERGREGGREGEGGREREGGRGREGEGRRGKEGVKKGSKEEENRNVKAKWLARSARETKGCGCETHIHKRLDIRDELLHQVLEYQSIDLEGMLRGREGENETSRKLK